MEVFQLRDRLVRDYEQFSRSFTTIFAKDIERVVAREYASGRFWPEPMIQINPNFASGGSVDDLVASGLLHHECARIFRIKSSQDTFGKPMVLHKHQVDAIHVARKRESYVLTTGTGSGKSLAYFIPIIDDVLRRKQSGAKRPGISAIIVYPMNALCNSQREELERYLLLGYSEGKSPVTFARYTGQESAEERDRIAKEPPDILLANYVMLELIMTRFLETDKAVRQHATGLRFLVLDELHTYRGRQGADVALLVRRVRQRFNADLLCVGTSATMASEDGTEDRSSAVARVASRLFGTEVKPGNVINETLESVTHPSVSVDRQSLADAINADLPADASYEFLTQHPVARWVEYNLGLEMQGERLCRTTQPKTLFEAASSLSEASGVPVERCRDYLEQLLLKAFAARDDKGRSLFAFKLHQFISGASNVYITLEPEDSRYISLDGQQFKPGNREKALYNVAFCRACGQEYLPVWATLRDKAPVCFSPRELTERSSEDEDTQFGYLMPDGQAIFDPSNVEKHYPDDWLEFRNGVLGLKPYYRRYVPKAMRVNTLGEVCADGLFAWHIQGAFRFCLRCGVHYDGSVRSDLTKLSGLSSEGRSSATTVLTLSILKSLIASDLDDKTKKLLGFMDNRQDASLQAGHFNDFIQILLLRGALLAAIRHEPQAILRDDTLTQRVLEKLRLEFSDFAKDATAKGLKLQNTLKTLRDVLGYRLYFDLQRGWRITSPNLEQLDLLKMNYAELMTCCEDEHEWQKCHPLLGSISPKERFRLAHQLLDLMRRGLCIKTIYLDPYFQEQTRNRSYNELIEPWGLSEDERMFSSAYMIPRPRPRDGKMSLPTVHISYYSQFGRHLKNQSIWGVSNPHYPKKFDEEHYNTIVDDMLSVLSMYGYVESAQVGPYTGYRINSSTLEWTAADEATDEPKNRTNAFFSALYQSVSHMLESQSCFLQQLEAREHTGQVVDAEERIKREVRFRRGLAPEVVADGKVEPRGLPVLFCTPTMELGVDISTLNAVYMRNVPPTPANYAQRSGRAGRSGQPALVVTYCAAKSPHDQYFFQDPSRMVAGVVNLPTIDLANEDLVRSHLHAVWLAETGVGLSSSVRGVLDLDQPATLPIHQEITAQTNSASVAKATHERFASILEMLSADLTPESAHWHTPNWLDNAVNSIKVRFDNAFRRWRSLYCATSAQMKLANDVLRNAAATEQERKEAKARYDEAYMQQNLLLDTRSNMNSDFYTYRYLASEGFLPGYNFPRLPLMAYIPGRKESVVRDGFLSRPRFLGLSEFGPQSIIYHEGSTYHVRRAILTIRDESSVTASASLPVQSARLCPECGYGHFGEQSGYERCTNCDSKLDGGRLLDNLYRIEQVATRRKTRITSDEEERQRQGYDMATTIRYAQENGSLRCEATTFSENREDLVSLRYGPQATIWRINLGWRRRKHKVPYGFTVDISTGEWTKDSQAPTDAEDDQVREGKSVQRITPFVEDTKNVLLLQPRVPLREESLVTLQYALKRGIESLFQIEEAELAAEPLPDPSKRNAILFYEAAEGGAGVLTRLTTDPTAFARVARRSLEICHYGSASGKWIDTDDLVDLQEDCEAGCYRCLLSYYNQPEHRLIDRKNAEVMNLLCRLARSDNRQVGSPHSPGNMLDELLSHSTSSLEKEWLHCISDNGHVLPDRAQPYLEQYNTRPDFAYSKSQCIVYIDGPHHAGRVQKQIDRESTQRLEDAGYTVVRFPADKRKWPALIAEYSYVFGRPYGKNEPE